VSQSPHVTVKLRSAPCRRDRNSKYDEVSLESSAVLANPIADSDANSSDAVLYASSTDQRPPSSLRVTKIPSSSCRRTPTCPYARALIANDCPLSSRLWAPERGYHGRCNAEGCCVLSTNARFLAFMGFSLPQGLTSTLSELFVVPYQAVGLVANPWCLRFVACTGRR